MTLDYNEGLILTAVVGSTVIAVSTYVTDMVAGQKSIVPFIQE